MYEWMSKEKFAAEYREVYPKAFRKDGKAGENWYIVKKAVRQFLEVYKTPTDWLVAPVDERVRFSQANPYIAAWAFTSRICAGLDTAAEQRRESVRQYIVKVREYSRNKTVIRFALHYGYITQAELDCMTQIRKSNLHTPLATHTLVRAKPFREFGPAEFSEAPLFSVQGYTKRTLEALHLRLSHAGQTGYRVVRPRKNCSRPSVVHLYNHAVLGRFAPDYLSWIDGASRSIVDQNLCALSVLAEYVDAAGLPDLAAFDYHHFVELTDWYFKPKGPGTEDDRLSSKTVAARLSQLKRFFRWGQGKAGFPATLAFPEEEWRSINKQSVEAPRKNEGRAFTQLEVAQQLADTVYQYRPLTETEKLCRWYCMLQMSTMPRMTYVLNLKAGRCLAPLKNSPEDDPAWGIYASYEDKAGHAWGNWPVLDERGVEAVRAAEARIDALALKPIPSQYPDEEPYVHLFQIDNESTLSQDSVRDFWAKMKTLIKARKPDGSLVDGSPHSYRSYLSAHIMAETGNLATLQTAGGWRNEVQLRMYLRSNLAKNALLFSFVRKYEQGDFTGHFFVRLVELLSSDEVPEDEVLRALTTGITADDFIRKYGLPAPTGAGKCMSQFACEINYACWGCPHFLLSRDDVNDAIRTMASRIREVMRMKSNSTNFDWNSPVVLVQTKVISLITQHLIALGLTTEQIDLGVTRYVYHAGQEVIG
ncbi:MAG TPA: hypothetical protein VD969_06500 [Symbiobacteriaceae bacterium]|nr:hypothetical protein [Symbiobacteriaceae bacterium]